MFAYRESERKKARKLEKEREVGLISEQVK
uniref:Uncharacterized protein n=1 Tax=Rhizophora mucronata TaxID=61149 RepID=A0A2P2R1Q1_RHIMU